MLVTVNMDDAVLIDVQGFKVDKNKFILKEICIHSVENNFKYHKLIKSPFKFEKLKKVEKNTIQWLTKNYHGIQWDSGNITFTQFMDDMKTVLKDKIIICKGLEKMKWLKCFFERISIQEIINCEDLDCNIKWNKNCEISEYFDSCEYHKNIKKSSFVCALKNVMLLRRWFFENYTIT